MTTNIQSFAGDVQIDSGNLSVKSLEVKDGVTKLGSNNTAYSNVGVMMTRKDGASNVAFLFTEDGANVVLGYTNDDALEGDRIDILTDEKANLVVYGNVYVTGSVHGDGSTLTGLVTTLQSVTEFGAETDQTILFTNEITGINVSSNVLVSGNVTANVYYGDGGLLANITQTLEGITAIGNTTPYTLEFNNTHTSFVTVSNVGIGNALPTADLCVGSNVVIDDERLNKINVTGNVACHQLNLGSIEILPAYSLENVTQIANTTTNTISFNHSTLAFDTQKMAGIGIIPSSADVGISGLHVDGHLRLGGEAENTNEEQMYIKAAGALGVLANHSGTNNTNTELRLQTGDTYNSNITMVGKSSAQYMIFGTNAAERMRIDSSGRVGIGLTNPSYKLDVSGYANVSTLRATSLLLSNGASTTITEDYIGANPYTYFTNSNDNDNSYMQFLHDFTGVVQAGSGPNSEIMSLQVRGKSNGTTDADTEVYIPGYLGVGTANPSHALEVYKNGGDMVKIGNNTSYMKWSNGGHHIDVYNVSDGLGRLLFLNFYSKAGVRIDDRLGVGGSPPEGAANLYVYGNTYITSNLTVGTDDIHVDTTTGNVGIGMTNPLGKLGVLSPLSNIEATDLNSLRSNAAINIRAYGDSNDYLSIGLLGSSANAGNNPSAYIQNRWDGGLAADLLLQPGGGNVGIGTTNPTARLELYSSTLDTNHITVYADNSIITQDRIFVLSDVNGSGLIQMGDRYNNDSTTYKIQLNTEGDSYFSGGNVGIGTTNPETALVVDGTITIRNGSQVNAIRTDSDGNLQFLRNAQTNDTPTITINDETGNVGVGTTNPAYTLDVNGSARVGALTATTGTFSGNVRCNSFTLSQKAGEQGEFIVERKDNGYTQSALPLAHIDAFGISVNIPNVDYTTTSSKLTFTIDDDNTGSRWMLKMLVRDAEGGASVRVNSGTTHELHYNDVPQDPREDNDDSWTTIDITDDVVYAGATNTIYWWAPTSDGSSVRAAYVFPTSGPALPNEPVETDLHLYNGLYVSSNLTVNTDDLFVDTQSGRVGVGTTNPKALLHIEQTLDPILRIQGTAGDSNAYIELRETDSDNYGASLYYEGTSSVQGLRFGHFDGSSTLRTDMAIDRGTGRVGIGTDSPSAPLHVYRDAGVSNFVEVARFETNHGDFDDSTILSDGGYLSFHTNDSNSGIGEVARIGWRCDNEDNSENDGMLEFYTKRDDTLNRVVTISSDGNIGIGVDKAAVNSTMYISPSEEQNSTQNSFVNVLYATITGSTALTAYRYASGFRTSFETQFSGSSTGARHYVRGVDSYTRATGTANPHYMYGVEGGSRTASTGTISYVLTGGRFYGYQEGTASQPVQSLYGVQAQAYKYGTGDVTYAVGVTSDVITNNGNITNKLGVSVAMTNDGSAITNSYQFKGVTNQTSGSITNIYGLHLSSNQNLDHYMEARDVQWRTQYNTNQVHLHLNKTNAQYAQNMNYTHYATQTSGSSQDPDSSMGLWMGNFTDENYGGRGRNFIAWTSTLQLYRTSDNTDFEDTLSFTSNSDVLNHAGTAFDKVGYFDGTTADSDLNNFTGQHRCLVEEVRHDQAEEHEGLIVCANKNEYFKMSGGTDFTF